MSGRYTVASCPGPGCSAGRDWAAKLLEMRAFRRKAFGQRGDGHAGRGLRCMCMSSYSHVAGMPRTLGH